MRLNTCISYLCGDGGVAGGAFLRRSGAAGGAEGVCVLWPRGAEGSEPGGRRRKERAWRCVVWPRGADGSAPGGSGGRSGHGRGI